MYWEIKLEELNKLAPVILTMEQRGRWTARFLTMIKHDDRDVVDAFPTTTGATPAGAVDTMWSHVVHGATPFILIGTEQPVCRVRFNARWEDVPFVPKQEVAPDPEPESEPPPSVDGIVVEEEDANAFDSAD